MISAWHEDFHHFEAGVFSEALRSAILLEPEAAKGFFPAPGAVYRRAAGLAESDGEAGLTPHSAWTTALSCARQFGNRRREAYRSLKHLPDLTRSILALGYDKLIRLTAAYNPHVQPMKMEEGEALRREFIKIYQNERTNRNEALRQKALGTETRIAIGEN